MPKRRLKRDESEEDEDDDLDISEEEEKVLESLLLWRDTSRRLTVSFTPQPKKKKAKKAKTKKSKKASKKKKKRKKRCVLLGCFLLSF